MNISECGEVEGVIFWPSDEIAAAFERVNAAMGKENETKEMRFFIRTMNYFYEQAGYTTYSLCPDETAEVIRLAKAGLNAELGIPPEEGT